MIVLLKELEVETIFDFSLKNCQKLIQSCLVSTGLLFFIQMLNHFARVALVLFIDNIESNLECLQVVFRFHAIILFVADQLLKQNGGAFWQTKMELALCNLVVVQTKALGLVLVDQEDHAKYLDSEILLFDGLDGKRECVAKHFLWVFRLLDCCLNFVTSTGLESDSNGLFEFAFSKTLVELLVDDSFHLWVDFDIFVFMHCHSNTLLCVHIDTLVDKGVDVFVVLRNIKQLAGFHSQPESVIMSIQMVQNFACHAGSQLSLGEAFLVNEGFNAWNFIGDLVPLVVSDLVEFLKSVYLLVYKVAFKHC